VHCDNGELPLDTSSSAAALQALDRDAASQAAMNGQNWHLNMLKLVGSWVAKGNTDKEIHIFAENHTLSGYTAEQTWLDVKPMIIGARRKNYDAPTNKNEAHDGPVSTSFCLS